MGDQGKFSQVSGEFHILPPLLSLPQYDSQGDEGVFVLRPERVVGIRATSGKCWVTGAAKYIQLLYDHTSGGGGNRGE